MTAWSVAQSAAATEAPTREAAACKDLQAPDASVAAAWTQASEARAGWGRKERTRRVARAATTTGSDDDDEDDDRVVALMFEEELEEEARACACERE